ncbi:hypothetical protein F4806DRAFT_508372 [Annulohypoxylon nitens]|nr:hypothetical protein F4806DRAFT_508372 [Annulohypoxylon nitens]
MAPQDIYGLEGKSLKVTGLQGLLNTKQERTRKIVRRCNWYMFNNPEITGRIASGDEFAKLCQTATPNYPPEQEEPNEYLANNPPPESFRIKYFQLYPVGSPHWVMRQDEVSCNVIQAVLEKAWEKWKSISTRAKQVSVALDSIPKPERINKVVCIGLGPILTALSSSSGEIDRDMLYPRSVAQHCLAIAAVKELGKKAGQKINLYTADLGYTPQHNYGIEGSKIVEFKVLNPCYGTHEQFTFIDDNTMLINFAGPPDCPTLSIIEEYARPVVIITEEVPPMGPYQDRQWFEVTEENGNKVQVPGCANLPLPDGVNTGILCPKRVRDMMFDEYQVELKFPAEDKNLELSWGKNDLVEYGNRNNDSADIGYYWFSNTRMYIRKH